MPVHTRTARWNRHGATLAAAFALVAGCMALALLVALADLRGPRTAAPRG